jgi:hypothetical protein
LLHDVPVRGYELAQIELCSKLWRVFDAFGRKEAEWLPYWRNGEYVGVAPEGAYASLYRHPKNGVLVVVSNLNRQETMVTVRLNWKRLGLPENLKAVDALTGEIQAMEKGQIVIPLKSLGWKLIWVRR